MKKSFDKLDNIFNIESTSSDVTNVSLNDVEVNHIQTTNDVKTDYEYSRTNMYSIIEKGQEAINGILEIAQETESPRAYEVVGQLIKNVSDATEKLVDLQKKLKDLDNDKIKSTTNVTNALFLGSTAELSKFLKSQREQNK